MNWFSFARTVHTRSERVVHERRPYMDGLLADQRDRQFLEKQQKQQHQPTRRETSRMSRENKTHPIRHQTSPTSTRATTNRSPCSNNSSRSASTHRQTPYVLLRVRKLTQDREMMWTRVAGTGSKHSGKVGGSLLAQYSAASARS
jgi:hypothetical protein